MTRAWPLLLVLSLVIAGCGDGPSAATDDVVVVSGQTATETPTAVPTPKGGEVGHIAGYVVDDALKPIRGARVQMGSLDLVDITDRNGAFEFVDLVPGSYLLKFNATGHQDAESVLDVKADRFTRAKVILHRIPPPEPRVEVLEFQGYAPVTEARYVLIGYCECSFDFQENRDGLQAVVIEAAMDPAANGQNGFDMDLGSQSCCAYYASASLPNPLWSQVDGADIQTADVRLRVYPWSDLVPETEKTFEVFVSSFYNMDVPAGYSVVGGA